MENYNLKMEEIIKENQDKKIVPSLFLHACCAPCSSAVIERLAKYFKITCFYYNPNITEDIEYHKRLEEIKTFVLEQHLKNGIKVIEGEYNTKDYFSAIKGHEFDKEGGERCYFCYQLRIYETAKIAKKLGFDYFTTTLSISPYKNALWLNEIGTKASELYGISYLYADFKKKNGYKRSIELSKEYQLYRQDYCGCTYSKIARQKDKNVL